MSSPSLQSSRDADAASKDTSRRRLAQAAEARADALHNAGDPKPALDSCIRAAELYIQARHEAATPAERDALERRCADVLAKAERWKAAARSTSDAGTKTTHAASPPPYTPKKRPPPESTSKLSVKEETLLLRSSKINGGIYPPWKANPELAEFAGEEDQFLDPVGRLKLSDVQEKLLDSWKRPREIYADAKVVSDAGAELDLTQDVVTDCSVVASLCSGSKREEKGFGATVMNILYPQDKSGVPLYSPSGKYIVKLFFNGCYRKVVIDDYLPASKSGRALYVTCRKNPPMLAPALIEKAYLKVMGGYDFPGSNSGTDLLALTGWIPEHIFLQSDEIVYSTLWRRMWNAWATGDVLITLGTGRMTKLEEIELGLVGEHDYAVLEMKEENGNKMMMVKNPWSDAMVWKGAPTEEEEDDDNSDDSGDFDKPKDTFSMKEFKDALPARSPLQPGVFWISLENICRNFASIYLNWNPSLFTHLHETHFTWDLSTKISETSFGRNPQFSITNPSSRSTTVWILLSRHLGLPNAPGMIRTGYISLYFFPAGSRIYLSSNPLHRTPYVDSPQTLLTLPDLPGKTTYTLVPSSQDLSPTTHHFSLSIFSLIPLRINPVSEPYPYCLSLNSTWNPSTSGGNAQASTYPNNPQFLIHLPTPSSIALLLETASAHPVHIKLLHSSGARATSVTTRDVIAESGEYSRSTAFASATPSLSAGKYTAVASTFEPGQLGAFTLTLLSTSPDAAFSELPSERAGMFETAVSGTWSTGCRRMCVSIDVGRLMRVWVVARCGGGAVRVSIVEGGEEGEEGEGERVLGDSGGWADCPAGVRTSTMDLSFREGGYSVVLERMGERGGVGWEVTVVSEGSLWVGEGEEM